MAKVYSVWNGASAAAAPVPVTTGTAIKTMIQLSTVATADLAVVEWSWEGDGFAAAAPGVVDLQFHAGAATVTQYVAADIKKYSANDVASLISLVAVTNSGYTASGEGTATSMFNIPHQVPPTAGFYIQYPQGREPRLAASLYLGLRNKFGTAINAICSVAWEE